MNRLANVGTRSKGIGLTTALESAPIADQKRIDANREMSLQAQRVLQEMLRRVTESRGWWGKVLLTVTVEDGEIKQLDETSNRTHRRRRL